ncbi:hypothetical protein SAMN05216480_11284 [Pustulibacterium marinum]|uniref:Tissue inhibitor of metalloproteinase n=1 Tax=Pustulibacterium marinum TaxID=1224947 RepID=A0A1I7I239_9FLAO|nr:hypothetical protein [Pustulibacterium marinum]SFU66991.1 hypothetical protein SAMN05216480_11284 [Pustulibacterium marinum]
MKSLILVMTLILFSTFQVFACDCECTGDCSFSSISNNSEFVALIKVISYDDYLDDEIMGYEGKMPYSMTVEIIKKYKGKETRNTIKIWGDNGAKCRPYISNFKIGEHYLIAPNLLRVYKLKGEKSIDYDFFSCNTDYLKVDIEKQKAYGEYTKIKTEIELKEFEEKLMI